MIVPILTGPELLYRMLASIDHPVGHLVVIDNGRCVGPRLLQDVAHVERVTVLPMPSNLGVSTSWNLGIKSTPFAPWWLIVNFDIVWPEGSLATWAGEDRRGSLSLSAGAPPWCAFSIGEDVVRAVGLFDEALHPAYFEDNDMERRVRHAGLPVITTGIGVEHDNSSTLRLGYRDKNQATFASNHLYYSRKVSMEDYSAGQWRLGTRRRQSWD